MIDLRRIFRPYFLLIPVLLLSSGACAGELPSLEQILERYVDALGGREAIGKLESRIIAGRQIDDRPYRGDPVESKLEAWADSDGCWAMVLHEPDGEKRTGHSDEGNAKLGFIFNPQGALMLGKYFPNPRVTGTWVYDGVEYYKVENDLKFEYYTLYFEVETGLLTRIGYHWWLEDLRRVDGVLVPFTVVQGRKGGSTNLIFDTIIHGDDVTEQLGSAGK